MQCKLTALTTFTTKYSANFHHHHASSSPPSLLGNFRVASYPSAKTLTPLHVNFSIDLQRRKFVVLRKFRSSNNGGEAEVDEDDQLPDLLQLGNSAILSACFVGLFTGIAIVVFNYTVTHSSYSISIANGASRVYSFFFSFNTFIALLYNKLGNCSTCY